MADREKVIKAIETHLSKDDSVGCDDCTYINDGWCISRIFTDVLDLLKEQEAVEPKKVKGFNPPIYLHLSFICDNCKTDLITNQPYCSGCGRPVKWE